MSTRNVSYLLLSSIFFVVSPSRTVHGDPGVLTQLPGAAGCVSETGSGGDCADGKALEQAFGVTVSRDGRSVYATSVVYDAVSVFARDKRTGALAQLAGKDGCVSQAGGVECEEGRALDAAKEVAVSGDGKHVYVTSVAGLAVFVRDKKTGMLAQLPAADGCVNGTGGAGCAHGKGLSAATGVAVSADRKHVYVASGVVDAMAVFVRDRKTGALTQPAGTDGCVSESGSGGECADGKALDGVNGVAMSRNGKHVYVASVLGDAIAVFARDKKTGALTQLPGTDGCVSESGSGGECADGKALDAPFGVAVSRDGRNVYVASSASSGLAAFSRDKRTGALTQLGGTDGCVTEFGSGGDCEDGKGLQGAKAVVVSGDGKHVYIGSEVNDAVTVFARDKKTGILTQLAGTNACVSDDGSGGECADGTALDFPRCLAVSRNGKNVYTASFHSDAAAVFERAKR